MQISAKSGGFFSHERTRCARPFKPPRADEEGHDQRHSTQQCTGKRNQSEPLENDHFCSQTACPSPGHDELFGCSSDRGQVRRDGGIDVGEVDLTEHCDAQGRANVAGHSQRPRG